jgi:K+-transporting ATPase ATPase A chain
MVLFFCFGLLLVHHFEQRGNPAFGGVHMKHGRLQSGGNMEGKEVRFGVGRPTLTVSLHRTRLSGLTTLCTTATAHWAAWCRW